MSPIASAAVGLLIGSAFALRDKFRRIKASAAHEALINAELLTRAQFLANESVGLQTGYIALIKSQADREIRIPFADIQNINLQRTHLKIDIDPANGDRVLTYVEEMVQ